MVSFMSQSFIYLYIYLDVYDTVPMNYRKKLRHDWSQKHLWNVSRWPRYCSSGTSHTLHFTSKGCFCIQKSFLLQSCSLMKYFEFTRRLGTLNTSFLTCLALTLVNSCQIYHVIYFATSPSCCTSHLSPCQGLVSRSWAGWHTRGANGRGGITCRLFLG